MKPLHTSYSNLGSWKPDRSPDGAELYLRYHARPIVTGAIFLFLICCIAAVLAAVHLPPDVKMKEGLIGIIILTGIVVPVVMVAHAAAAVKKGPLLSYHVSTDTLLVSDPPAKITPASERVSFSSEHFSDGDHRFEFNLVVDGERRKFLSSISSFKNLSRHIREMGFQVSEHKVKL
ncbi:hypothetical protein OVA24_18975 [Luteolibacter sp. SL250]|uniref:hypothetical protein n=1 Tax=Luteolibacter sp. SL250 TaxID=2995170 RepID=UPI00226E7545|nr:hypothetical protein [Luteolibacter sp. SL250]WAC19314.1 hypothetical protein OVA24_18975 [Luteolibacter sp. SL250]